MKIKHIIMGSVLSLMLVCSIKTNALAFNSTLTSSEMAGATAPIFNTEQTGTWNDAAFKKLYKISLTKPGIITVNATKANSNDLGKLSMNYFIYDAQGNEMLMYRDERKKDSNATWSIGLDKGTYYINFCPQYSPYAKAESFKYTIKYTATDYAEKEKNDSGKTATVIETDTKYTGFFGNGFSNINSNKDKEDDYKVYLIKGYTYQFYISNTENIAGVWQKESMSGFPDIDENKDFVAPYTGWYYPGLYNYGNDQYQYTIEVKTINVPCPTTKIKSMKRGNKAMTITWTKKTCDGYDITYSTDKNFKKSVKTVSVGKSKTTKKTIKKLKKGKTYYAKVRTYKLYKGKKYTSKWSSAKKVKI